MQFLYARIAETTYPTPPARKEHTAMIWKENRENTYCEITPELLALKQQWEKKNYIDPQAVQRATSSGASGMRMDEAY